MVDALHGLVSKGGAGEREGWDILGTPGWTKNRTVGSRYWHCCDQDVKHVEDHVWAEH